MTRARRPESPSSISGRRHRPTLARHAACATRSPVTSTGRWGVVTRRAQVADAGNVPTHAQPHERRARPLRPRGAPLRREYGQGGDRAPARCGPPREGRHQSRQVAAPHERHAKARPLEQPRLGMKRTLAAIGERHLDNTRSCPEGGAPTSLSLSRRTSTWLHPSRPRPLRPRAAPLRREYGQGGDRAPTRCGAPREGRHQRNAELTCLGKRPSAVRRIPAAPLLDKPPYVQAPVPSARAQRRCGASTGKEGTARRPAAGRRARGGIILYICSVMRHNSRAHRARTSTRIPATVPTCGIIK